jgi:hypothetical protein
LTIPEHPAESTLYLRLEDTTTIDVRATVAARRQMRLAELARSSAGTMDVDIEVTLTRGRAYTIRAIVTANADGRMEPGDWHGAAPLPDDAPARALVTVAIALRKVS